MKYSDRQHSQNCVTGKGDCEKTGLQKFKFFLAWWIPIFLWSSIIYLNIPIPLLRDFFDKIIHENINLLMAPVLLWSVAGLFYGFKKEYLIKGKGWNYGSE